MLSCALRRIAPRRCMIGITAGSDRIDKGRMVMILRCAWPGNRRAIGSRTAIARKAAKTLTTTRVLPMARSTTSLMPRNKPTASRKDSDDDELLTRLAKCRAFADHDGAGSVTNSGTDGKDASVHTNH